MSASHVRALFGQRILWCPLSKGGSHLSETELEPYRQVGDPCVDDLLERLHQEGSPLRAGGDILELIEGIERGDDTTLSLDLQKDLIAFIERYRTVPEWVNVEQLQSGRNVFLAYTPAMGAALYYRSLVPGFSIPNIAAVIQSTGYLTSNQVATRLMDTGALLTSCMTEGISTLFAGGSGWKAALYVRILHAKVRRALLKRENRKWDTKRLGVPINQEDMAATLLAFSVNALVGVEFVAGLAITPQEQLDYLALWRYIGWLLGVHTVNDEAFSGKQLRPLDPCGPGWFAHGDPIVHSRSILMSIIFHLMKPDESSILVANHLLKIGRSKNQDESLQEENKRIAWFYFRSLQCRRFIGDPLADALQLPRHNIWWKRWLIFSVSTLYLSFLRMYTLAVILCPSAKRRIQRWHLDSMTRFHENWLKSHRTRMAEALRKAKGQAETPESCCPFAMVSPPNY
jgi:ER-bound oxygenase mpaB/B'/Rubber oxygenase, catalytic domain